MREMQVVETAGNSGSAGFAGAPVPDKAASASAPGSLFVPSNLLRMPPSQYVGTALVARNILTFDEGVSAVWRFATIPSALMPFTWAPFPVVVPVGPDP